ncbi:WD_REPEATS_REGION domain-containing protein, partial [Psidium guajava]
TKLAMGVRNVERYGTMARTADPREEDEEEHFYESLDRITSSSSCSCSNSDDEAEDPNPDSNFASLKSSRVPKFPKSVAKYDVWISEPSSVLERRSRLLQEMGLRADPSLSRAGTEKDAGQVDFARSVSSHCLRGQENGGNSVFCRSKSEASSDRNAASGDHCKGTGSPVASAISPNKPPIAKYSRKMDELKSDSVSSAVGLTGNSMIAFRGGVVQCNGDADDGSVCTIKNLDNGKEFVVNEFREDGSWNKLKEVGTGRQLTLEEFEMTVGHSPIVQELMRRQNVEEGNKDISDLSLNEGNGVGSKLKKKGSWLKSIRNVASTVAGGHMERRSSDEKDTASEKGGGRSSSATDDSQDASFPGPERVRVRQYGKSCKDLTALYKSQEIQAHNGSIWSIKFSLDGRYLASAGEDRAIHIWRVSESEGKGELLVEKPEEGNFSLLFTATGSPERTALSPNADNYLDRKRRGRSSLSRKSVNLDHVLVPETVFSLTEKPICSFRGHLDDVLDLSWSKSQHLLSSSMDKTVRLWHLSSKSCLKIFSHSDYVTCIQFNPVDDRYFISGSLDAKVRIWSVPDHQVVDWNDLHEMVTAACYTPDGQGALVGSYEGSCLSYDTSDNKLQQRSRINLQNKKKKSQCKKITGFQFAPGSSSEVLITSADSRIRVVDGVDLVHKFKGFRNTNSQISALLTANGKYIVSASENSYVYVWKHEADSRTSKSKGITVTRSYEHFHCQDVSVAIPWPGMGDAWGLSHTWSLEQDMPLINTARASTVNHPPTPVEEIRGNEASNSAPGCGNSALHGTLSSATNNYFLHRLSGSCSGERLTLGTRSHSRHVSMDFSNGMNESLSAWGLVIVTASLRGELRTFQNFGFPLGI